MRCGGSCDAPSVGVEAFDAPSLFGKRPGAAFGEDVVVPALLGAGAVDPSGALELLEARVDGAGPNLDVPSREVGDVLDDSVTMPLFAKRQQDAVHRFAQLFLELRHAVNISRCDVARSDRRECDGTWRDSAGSDST